MFQLSGFYCRCTSVYEVQDVGCRVERYRVESMPVGYESMMLEVLPHYQGGGRGLGHIVYFCTWSFMGRYKWG